MTDVGGTPGGGGMFLSGLVMLVGGGYMLLTHVTVASGVWQIFGMSAFGLSLLPLLVGVGILFFNGKSAIGWLLTIAGATIIVAGILMNMSIYFRPTSLFDTLLMLGLIAGGLGFIARAIRAAPAQRA